MPVWNGTLQNFAAGETPTASKMQNQVDVLAALSGPWTTWTPVLTADVSNPALGTAGSGMVATGKYWRVGKKVEGNFTLKFGTVGGTVGSGLYIISLPITAVTTASVVGHGYVYDVSNATAPSTTFEAVLYNTGTINMRWTGGNVVTHALPFGWAGGDQMHGSFSYEAA